MLRIAWWSLALAVLCATQPACDMGKFTVNTTAKVLVRAQPAMNQESDYELAARAIPATLKTVEGFHVVNPDNRSLTRLLAEGYCQYATGFIEDEWERDKIKNDADAVDEDARRATKVNLRCMNYGLELLGSDWKKVMAGDIDGVRAKARSAGRDQESGLLWTAIGLAGAINFNREDIGLVAQLPKVRILLERLVELDAHDQDRDVMYRALPYVALGQMDTALGKALGGHPDKGGQEFQKALDLTGGKFLLAKVLYARYYAVAVQNKKLFEKTLVEVLQTDPAIWPEQRLANEIAHRWARRYLKQEKEWF